MLSHVLVHVCLGCGVDVDLWWEGGAATAQTDFHVPQENHKPLLSAICSPLQRPLPDSTQCPRNKHKLPLFSTVWLARGCARRLIENTCLYHNHNTVDLQREAPAHARTTQNITDHLVNTEIESQCNVKAWGYRGLARPGKILFTLALFTLIFFPGDHVVSMQFICLTCSLNIYKSCFWMNAWYVNIYVRL